MLQLYFCLFVVVVVLMALELLYSAFINYQITFIEGSQAKKNDCFTIVVPYPL